MNFAGATSMDFKQNCQAASAALLELSTRVQNMEIQLLRLDHDRRDTDLLTLIVTGLFETKDLSEELLHNLVPAIREEEPAVSIAIGIAHQELMRRYWGVRDDLEVLTKVQRPRTGVIELKERRARA